MGDDDLLASDRPLDEPRQVGLGRMGVLDVHKVNQLGS
jgi:hypothetical protein